MPPRSVYLASWPMPASRSLTCSNCFNASADRDEGVDSLPNSARRTYGSSVGNVRSGSAGYSTTAAMVAIRASSAIAGEAAKLPEYPLAQLGSVEHRC